MESVEFRIRSVSIHRRIKGPSAWQVHNAEVEAFTQENGVTGDYVHCVLQDREGNVWFGTSGGLDRFRQSPIVSVPLLPISYPGALPNPIVALFYNKRAGGGRPRDALVCGYRA